MGNKSFRNAINPCAWCLQEIDLPNKSKKFIGVGYMNKLGKNM